MEEKICCLCGKFFTGSGHTAIPLTMGGYCCDSCHTELVIPAQKANQAYNSEIEKSFPTIGIFAAGLSSTGTTDCSSNYCEYAYVEASEEYLMRDWHGDVRGYLENLDNFEEDFIILENSITIHNEPRGAILTGALDGTPREIYFPKIVTSPYVEDEE